MDYSINDAKSIFDLLAQASPYALPLLVSLIFPIIWIIIRKTLGVTNNKADSIVFYSCITLFFTGLVILKLGEYHEECIRQRALSLKAYFIHEERMHANLSEIPPDINKELLDDILFKFPAEFIYNKHPELGYVISYLDSSYNVRHEKQAMQILQLYLENQFLTRNIVYVDSLYDIHDFLKRHFPKPYVYHYVSLPENRDKYYLAMSGNGKEIIIKR